MSDLGIDDHTVSINNHSTLRRSLTIPALLRAPSNNGPALSRSRTTITRGQSNWQQLQNDPLLERNFFNASPVQSVTSDPDERETNRLLSRYKLVKALHNCCPETISSENDDSSSNSSSNIVRKLDLVRLGDPYELEQQLRSAQIARKFWYCDERNLTSSVVPVPHDPVALYEEESESSSGTSTPNLRYSSSFNPMHKIKVWNGDEIIAFYFDFQLREDTNLDDVVNHEQVLLDQLEFKVKRKFGIISSTADNGEHDAMSEKGNKRYFLCYRDEEGDWVSIQDGEDLIYGAIPSSLSEGCLKLKLGTLNY